MPTLAVNPAFCGSDSIREVCSKKQTAYLLGYMPTSAEARPFSK